MFENSGEIYTALANANGGRLKYLKPDDITKLKQKFDSWEDQIRIKSHSLSDYPEAYYDHAWTIIHDISPFAKSKYNAKLRIYVIAAKFGTHQLFQFSFPCSSTDVLQRRTSAHIAKLIPEIAPAAEYERQLIFAQESRAQKDSFDLFYTAIEIHAQKSIRHFEPVIESHARPLKIFKKTKPLELAIAKQIVASIFQENLDFYKNIIEEHVDKKALLYAKAIHEDKHIARNFSLIDIYNHLVKTQKFTPQARDYRYAALQQFLPLGELFLTLDIWDHIDEDKPPLKILADSLGVKPSTLKHMAQREYIFKLGKGTKDVACYLDAIDLVFWPKSKEDFQGLEHVIKIAETYAIAFSREPVETVSIWTKDRKHALAKSWHHLAHDLLKDEIKWLFENPVERMKHLQIQNRRNKPYILNIHPDYVHESFERLPAVIKTLPAFWSTAIQRFSGVVSNIKDMKNDVSKRIIQPIILLELERQGFRIAEQSIINNLVDRLTKNFWASMIPSDQRAASSYWHSPAVNISRRFQSASLSTNHSEWPGLVPNAFKLSNDVLFHPLISGAALQEEANAMKHCIWSYGSYFYAYNYHMLSLTDVNGKRLSSLTIQDFFNDKNERQVRFSQNKAYDNSRPPDEAIKAANLLIEAINQRKFLPDWEAIDTARADYKSRQIENAAGYDFRDPEQREKVFDVYRPCIPKRLLKGTDKNFEVLSKKLEISQTVTEFVSSFDFSQGGITRIQNSGSTNPPRAQIAEALQPRGYM